MEAFKKLFKYLGVGGAFALIALTLILIFLIGPAMMLWGLILMGFDIEYSMKTFFGAALVIIALRAGGTSKSKSNG